MPSKANPSGLTDRAEIERRIAESMAVEEEGSGAE
jgi:hypothetical protein